MENTENLVAHMPRISWDEVFMAMACVYAMRSPDPSTRHGCVVVKDNVPVGFGYNGFPKGGKDDSIYPMTRPGKYTFLAHFICLILNNHCSEIVCWREL